LSHASIYPCNGDILSYKNYFVNRKIKIFLFFLAHYKRRWQSATV